MKRAVKLTALSMVLALPQTAAAQQVAPEAPAPQIDRLINCRSIADPQQRLACYDREAGAVAESLARKDLVVVDRDQVKKTKRTLFGLSIPNLGLFDDDKETEVSQVEGEVARVARNGDGGFVFFLKDGARWSQIDSRPIALEPEPGDKVIIKRAALGSYMLSVNRQPSVRVQRIN